MNMDGYNPNDEVSRERFKADVAEGIRRGTMATWTADQRREYNRQNFQVGWGYVVALFWLFVVGIPVGNWIESVLRRHGIAFEINGEKIMSFAAACAVVYGIAYTTTSWIKGGLGAIGIGRSRRRY